MPAPWTRSRSYLLQGAVYSAAAAAVGCRPLHAPRSSGRVTRVPLSAVRLTTSLYLDAVESNRVYLHRLEPDRFLHNCRQQAGLAPKAAPYGGWEQETIAGHSLGHYLSARALMHAQTGDTECPRRAPYIRWTSCRYWRCSRRNSAA